MSSPSAPKCVPRIVPFNWKDYALLNLVLLTGIVLFYLNDFMHFTTFTRLTTNSSWFPNFEPLRTANGADFSPWYMYALTKFRFCAIAFLLGLSVGAACDRTLPSIRPLRIAIVFLPVYVGMIALFQTGFNPMSRNQMQWACALELPLIFWQSLGMALGMLFGLPVAARLSAKIAARLRSSPARASTQGTETG